MNGTKLMTRDEANRIIDEAASSDAELAAELDAMKASMQEEIANEIESFGETDIKPRDSLDAFCVAAETANHNRYCDDPEWYKPARRDWHRWFMPIFIRLGMYVPISKEAARDMVAEGGMKMSYFERHDGQLWDSVTTFYEIENMGRSE